MNTLNRLYSLIVQNPNDKELGEIVRDIYGTDAQKWDKSKDTVTREQALRRVDYLKTELGHENYHDGWTIKGMKEELKWLELELDKLEEKQLNLFNELN
tara:strand:+ start:563 stop:859 length:297 start_codon:yes stop_codon:yes gene_type:complete